MNQIVIHPDQNGYIFPLFYFLALLLGIIIFLIEGSKKRYPQKDLWLILGVVAILGIAGSKLFAVTLPDLKTLLTSFQLPSSGKKTILGGLAGILIGFVFALSWLRMNRRVMDNLAIALPMGMAIQRVGCLMAGCCFGKPTGFAWGIHYSHVSRAFSSQVHNGLVQACDFSTLPVHPTQAYEILCCLLIAVLVWRFRRYLKAPGSILLFSVILYSCSRFFIEFFRDPDNSFIPFYFLGIKLIQWMVLAGIVILAGLLVTREKIFSRKKVIETTVEPALFRRVSLSLVLLFLFLLTKNWFDLTERTAAFVIVFPSIVLAGTDLFRHFSVPKYRFLTILVFCSSFFLMSQTYIPQNAGEKIKYKEISIGGIAGAYNTSFKKMMQVWVPPYEYQDCGGDTVIYPGHYDNILGLPQKLRHQSYVGSAGITFHEVRSKYRRSEWGFYVFGGNETESLSDGSYQKKNLILGINPSFRFDWKWIGFGYGFYAGTFRFSQFRSSENTDAGSQEIVRNLPFFPQLSFRVGPYDILFAEVNLNRQFPSGSPLQLLRFGLGTGFGKTDGTRLGIGYSTTGFYGETYIPIKEKFAIEASYANTLQPDMKAAWCFSLGLHYRFDFKTAKVTVREKKEPIPKHRIQKSNDN